jgi:hypothetical protein
MLVLALISAITFARKYERVIVFRLGRLFPEPKGPAWGSQTQAATNPLPAQALPQPEYAPGVRL